MALLQQSNRPSLKVLESASAGIAEQLSVIYGINSPEFFDKSLFSTFLKQLKSEQVVDTELAVGENFSPLESATASLNISNKMKFMLRVEVRDASSEVALLRAPGIENEIGGPYALVPRSELAQMFDTFNTTSMQIGSWALDAMRVASGRPRLGFDTDAKAIPNELGMLNKSVHMKKGCYRGQETIAKIANLGKPPRRLTMLHLDGS